MLGCSVFFCLLPEKQIFDLKSAKNRLAA